MNSNPLRKLNELGQSVWLDYIRRGEIESGELKGLIDKDGVSGVTSNPTIFEKAIAGSNDYWNAITSLARAGKSANDIFDKLAIEDIQRAADLFRPTYDSTEGQDGFVSIEVSPTLARDTAATMAEARRLWRSVNRPNILVKIPGTKEGLPAIEAMLAEGVNINITLLFAVERYEEVAEAYLSALEKRANDGRPLNRIASVASFFVSRIDTLADRLLEEKVAAATDPATRAKIQGLLGAAAIANAKVAYQRFKNIFASARFKPLAAKGARVQRVLWASTSTKNPKYRDVVYVESLIGADTIDTLPPTTLSAFREHGRAALTVDQGLFEAKKSLAALGEVGVDLAAVTRKLEDDGVASFSADYAKLMVAIEAKRKQAVAELTAPAAGRR